MKAQLHGGPVDRRIMDDVPDTTESIKIPSANNRVCALYIRNGYQRGDETGRFLRFDFSAVFDTEGRPLMTW